MTLQKVLAGMTAGLALALLSGCGGGGSKGTSGTSTPKASSSNASASLLQLAKCVREHGVPNFPDPTQAPDGSWQFPPTAENQKLPEACSSIKRNLGGQSSGPKQPSTAEMGKLRQFAQCMRQHGLSDWPDPQPDGSFALPSRISQGGKAVSKTQMDACRQYLPSGGFSTTDSGS